MKHRSFVLLMTFILMVAALAGCGGATIDEPSIVLAAEPAPSSTPQPTTAPTSPPAGTPSPTAVPTEAAPSPTPQPTATPESSLLTVPAAPCCRGWTLEAGQYALPPWLGIPLAFEVGEGWRVMNEEQARLFLLGRGDNVGNIPSQVITFMDAGDAAPPDSLIAAAHDISQLAPVGESVSVAIAGFPGRQLDAVARPNPDEKGDPANDIPPGVQPLPFFQRYFAPGFLWTTFTAEARVRTAALSVGERTLLLYMEAPAAEFDQFIADADTILWTLRPSE